MRYNFLFADDAPELMAITKDFFENFVRTEAYEVFVSEFVIQEINKTNDEERRLSLLNTIIDYPIGQVLVENQDELRRLADLYIFERILPEKKYFDALHVALCVMNKIDYLVSWNYKHLANINRERKILALNYSNNYLHPLRIITPAQLTDYEI